MTYLEIPPSPSLAPYIRFFWVLESDFPGGTSYVHRTLASGCPEIVFHYKGIFREVSAPSGPTFLSGVSGQTTHFHRYQIEENFGIFGAYIYPFAIPALFSVSAVELSDQMVDFPALCGREGAILQERILEASDTAARVRILTGFLESRLRRETSPILFAIREVIHSEGQVDVAALSDQCFRSKRQFERDFKTHAGFSPKLFARISRFQGAIALFGQAGISLTQIAYACGYYDQSHFIHDFKEFSGHHPREYFQGRAEAAQWKV